MIALHEDLGSRQKAVAYKRKLLKLLEPQIAAVHPISIPDSTIESVGALEQETASSGHDDSREEKPNSTYAPTSDVPTVDGLPPSVVLDQ